MILHRIAITIIVLVASIIEATAQSAFSPFPKAAD